MFSHHTSVPALKLSTWYLIRVLDLLFSDCDLINTEHIFDHNLNNCLPILMMLSFIDWLSMWTHFLNLQSNHKCWRSRSYGGPKIIWSLLDHGWRGGLPLANNSMMATFFFGPPYDLDLKHLCIEFKKMSPIFPQNSTSWKSEENYSKGVFCELGHNPKKVGQRHESNIRCTTSVRVH